MARELVLNRGFVALVDDDLLEELSHYSWRVSRRAQKSERYSVVRTDWSRRPTPRIVSLHRQVIQACPGQIVDHINRDPLDNRRENLRVVTVAQNAMNRSKSVTAASRYLGVYRFKARWVAKIGSGGKLLHLGLFDSEIEAAQAFDLAAKALRGEFAALNFPEAA